MLPSFFAAVLPRDRARRTLRGREPSRATAYWLAAALLVFLGTAEKAAAAVATQVSAGYQHTCALDTSGGVSCWGRNSEGQLGDGTTTDRTTPVGVVGLASGVASVAAGTDFTCVVTTAGGAKCWGSNLGGKLGVGGDGSPTPVDVTGLTSGVAAIDTGDEHACVLTTAGGVKCWGSNVYGELGNGVIGSGFGPTPVDVVGLTSGVIAIATGPEHSCAVTSAGAVKCWGRNYESQLGDGGSETASGTPVDVVGLASGAVTIDAGSHEDDIDFLYRAGTCALTSAGGLKCWGAEFESTAADVQGLTSGVTAVSLGGEGGGLALLSTGAVERFNGPLASPYLAEVNGLRAGIAGVTVGVFHQCALTTLGEVKCWGSNPRGELGEDVSGFQVNESVPGCVVGFGDSDEDRICDSADPCSHGATFIAKEHPNMTLSRVNADVTPGNDGLKLRARFALPPGVAFGDLDPAVEGARLTVVDPGDVVIDRTFAAGTYGGPGTAGWFENVGHNTWRFVDATTSPVTETVMIADRSHGAPGGEVDVTVTLVRDTIPLVTSDVPLQAIVVLGGAAAGSAGRCGQSDFRTGQSFPPQAECSYNGQQTKLSCRVRAR